MTLRSGRPPLAAWSTRRPTRARWRADSLDRVASEVWRENDVLELRQGAPWVERLRLEDVEGGARQPA